MHLKRRISWPPDVSALDTLNDYTLQKYLAEKSLLSALYSETLKKNTSEEFIKCRLDNFSMSFILYYANFSICENK